MKLAFSLLGAKLIIAALTILALPVIVFGDINSSTSVKPNSPRNQILKLTDNGLVPSTLKMKAEDSIVFFVNDTRDSLTTLEIDFGAKPSHCSGGNLRVMNDNKIKSVRPFGPNDFASTCFHASGEYPLTVYGLKRNPSGIKTTIIVE